MGADRLNDLTHKAAQVMLNSRRRGRMASGLGTGFASDSIEDIAQETALRVLSLDRSVELKGANLNAYVAGIARTVIREWEPADSGRLEADQRALRLFREMCFREAQVLGRELTQAEMNFVEGRVTSEMREQGRSVSADFRSGGRAATDLSDLTAESRPTSRGGGRRDGDAFDTAAAGIEARGRKGFYHARAHAYNMMAEAAGAPPAKRACLSRFTAAQARRVMGSVADGPVEAIRQWEAGLDNPLTEALFAPFGDTDGDTRRQIVDLLSSSSYCRELWDSATIFADSTYSPGGTE